VRLAAGGRVVRGEFVLSARGVEGGGIYALADLLRDGAPLTLDLVPDRSLADTAERLARPRGKASLANHLRRTLALGPVKVALLRELAPEALDDPAATARALKALPLPLDGPRPLDEAISTAGGVMRAGLDDGLMLRARPGVFAAGEMLDWDAPTGGYLLTACLATGRRAGRSAAAWLECCGRRLIGADDNGECADSERATRVLRTRAHGTRRLKLKDFYSRVNQVETFVNALARSPAHAGSAGLASGATGPAAWRCVPAAARPAPGRAARRRSAAPGRSR
jgi:hypothetical protein